MCVNNENIARKIIATHSAVVCEECVSIMKILMDRLLPHNVCQIMCGFNAHLLPDIEIISVADLNCKTLCVCVRSKYSTIMGGCCIWE